MTKTPEEKAREYAENNTIPEAGYILNSYKGFLAGYHSRDEEVKELMEALKGIIQECEDWTIPNAEKANNSEYDYCIEIDDLKVLIEKAKQLLNKQ